MPAALPQLFDRVPAGLFAPLVGVYAPLAWEILGRFYQFEFEGEPQYLIKETAHEIVVLVLRESPLWAERREELAREGTEEGESLPGEEAELERATARRLLVKLERAGWYHFEYRSTVGHVLSFHPHAARLLETLVRIARDEQPLFQGFAHAIAALLRPEAVAARPGVALREAKRHTLDLMRELKILERNIHLFTQRLLDRVATAAEVLEEGLERYRGAVLANYHRLKTIDNLYKWRGEITHRLDAIERDELVLSGAARWYAEQDGVDEASAARRVGEDLRLLRAEFETLPRLIDDIDERNARFSGVALRKLMYLLRHDGRMEGQLQLVVDRLARDQAPELELDVFACQLLGDAFLYTAPRQRPKAEPQPLRRVARLDTDALRGALAPRLRRPFARARVEAFVDGLLGGRAHVSLAEAPLDGDEDYVRTIYMLAYGLDGASRYRFERIAAAPGRLVKGSYRVPAGTLVRCAAGASSRPGSAGPGRPLLKTRK